MAIGRWTAVIVNYNGADYLGPCIDALQRATLPPADIIVVDNASTDDSLQELVAYPRANVLRQRRNLGFGGGANAGLATVETDVALLMNPDVEIEPGFGEALVAAFETHPRLGAAGALLIFPDGVTVQHAGGTLHWPKMWTEHREEGQPIGPVALRETDVDYVVGGSMGLRLAAVREVGWFDERFYPAYYEDVDLCLRLRQAGWGVHFFPQLRALHHAGVTLHDSPLRYHFSQANRLRFAVKHLSREEWRSGFIPAEIASIRHQLHAAGDDWPARSGLTALEAVLRNPDLPTATTPMTDIHAALLPGVQSALHAARLAAILPQTTEPALGVIGRLREVTAASQLSRLVDEAFTRQQEFNAAVVAALEAQDKLNREQLAIVLTLALDALQFVPVNQPPPTLPITAPADSADES